jgi:hypothetical protein
MLSAVPGRPFFFTAPADAVVTIASLSHGAGPNEPAFRYAGKPLDVVKVNVGQNRTQPGATFVVVPGRRRLSAIAPFATKPPRGEFFFQEVIVNGNNISLMLLGSVVPDDETIAWTIEGV